MLAEIWPGAQTNCYVSRQLPTVRICVKILSEKTLKENEREKMRGRINRRVANKNTYIKKECAIYERNMQG